MDEESTFWNTVRATSITGLDPSNLPRSGVLRCRASGLRPKDRPELWLFLSGGAAMAADHPAGTYASLTKASRLPKEILYAIDDDAAGRQPVRRLLVAAYNHLGAAAARDAAAAGRAKPDPSAPAPTLSPQSYCRGLASLASFVLAVQGAGGQPPPGLGHTGWVTPVGVGSHGSVTVTHLAFVVPSSPLPPPS
jgi:hypothetical protein